ncbi:MULTISPECIES: MarR family winged helix-turn-helix transcriptional regulator [unclassified Paludibacterium]|uniref:MarR family winged helix-turn-helix transcriptional regulator n=1 Tax=unclassified Paludibacterium TaxID=2618429 RepID=UPI001C0535B0|nr:MarR family transcriptional regulator [Paludibacterium sp. B53371]BEV70820.1 MarR family transcriptional regulator [Paludibacterium sp. THUN1379]
MRKQQSAARPPAPGEGKRGEDGHLGYLLRQAAAMHRLKMERALSDLGVTPPQFSVLTMLAAYPGQSNADIARLAMLTPPTVTVIVGNLESMGAVLRRPHAQHGRIQHIDLTEQGMALLASCRARVQQLEAALAAGLSESETTLLRRWLAGVAREGEAEGTPP